jgi:hypothetical protein
LGTWLPTTTNSVAAMTGTIAAFKPRMTTWPALRRAANAWEVHANAKGSKIKIPNASTNGLISTMSASSGPTNSHNSTGRTASWASIKSGEAATRRWLSPPASPENTIT